MRVWVSVATFDGLAAPFVAFNLGHFATGTLMLLGAFATLALGMIWDA